MQLLQYSIRNIVTNKQTSRSIKNVTKKFSMFENFKYLTEFLRCQEKTTWRAMTQMDNARRIHILTTADNASYGSILVDFLIQAFMLLKKKLRFYIWGIICFIFCNFLIKSHYFGTVHGLNLQHGGIPYTNPETIMQNKLPKLGPASSMRKIPPNTSLSAHHMS